MGGQAKADQDMSAPRLLGFRLKGTRQTQFLILSAGCVLCAVLFATFQEGVYRVPGFHFSGWMTFLTYVSFVCCGMAERFLTADHARRAPLQHYAMVSLGGMSGVYLTNWALQYLNYTVRVVFKSCKVIPVMLFGTLLQGRVYGRQEYAAAILLVVGTSLFTAAGKSGGSQSQLGGVALITVALIFDATTSNLEERLFFRKAGSSQTEVGLPCHGPSPLPPAAVFPPCLQVVFFMSIFGMLYSGAALIVTGEAWQALRHSIQHPEVIGLISMFSVMAYMSVSFVLLLIKHFNATNTEIVKSMRKVLQVAASFVVYPKPFDWKYIMGGAAICAALWWFGHLKKAGKQMERHGSDAQLAAAATAADLQENGSSPVQGSRIKQQLHHHHHQGSPGRQ